MCLLGSNCSLLMISEDVRVPRKTWSEKSKTFRNSFQMVILKGGGINKNKSLALNCEHPARHSIKMYSTSPPYSVKCTVQHGSWEFFSRWWESRSNRTSLAMFDPWFPLPPLWPWISCSALLLLSSPSTTEVTTGPCRHLGVLSGFLHGEPLYGTGKRTCLYSACWW